MGPIQSTMPLFRRTTSKLCGQITLSDSFWEVIYIYIHTLILADHVFELMYEINCVMFMQ